MRKYHRDGRFPPFLPSLAELQGEINLEIKIADTHIHHVETLEFLRLKKGSLHHFYFFLWNGILETAIHLTLLTTFNSPHQPLVKPRYIHWMRVRMCRPRVDRSHSYASHFFQIYIVNMKTASLTILSFYQLFISACFRDFFPVTNMRSLEKCHSLSGRGSRWKVGRPCLPVFVNFSFASRRASDA